MFRRIASGLCLVVLAAVPAAFGQDAGMASVLSVHVQPGHQQHYESVLPKLWEAFKKAGVTTPITVSASVEDVGTYTFIAPVASFTELGTLRAAVNKAAASVPEVMSELGAMSLGQDQSIWAPRPDLAYTPATPRLQESEQGFARVAFVYPRADQVQALEAALREAAAMRKKHGLTDGTFVAQLVIGEDAPAYVVVISAKDDADFYAQNAKALQKMGPDWQAYLNKVGPLLRRVELTSSTARPALNYQP
jgi:hypothetical protein